MWKAGALVGAILGLLTGDIQAMLAGALLGAILGKAVSIVRLNTSPDTDQALRADQPEHERRSTPAAESSPLHDRVEQLERRLAQVEAELAQLRQGVTPTASTALHASDDAAQAQAQAQAPAALQPQPSAVIKEVPAATDPWTTFGAAIGTENQDQPKRSKLLTRNDSDANQQARPLPAKPQLDHQRADQATEKDAAQATPQAATQAPAQPKHLSLPPADAAAVIPAPTPQPPRKTWRERLPAPVAALLLGGNTVAKVGVLILFLGLAFLLRYAAERVSLPVEYRYAGVALTGTVLLALGGWLRTRRRDFAIVLQGAGVGVFYLTTLAAMKLHPLLSPAVGFGFLAAVAALGATLAVAQNASALAIIAALGGFAAPVLTSTGSNQPIGLFSYLAVLDVAIAAIAWFKAWRVLNLIGLTGTLTLAAGWGHKHYTDAQYPIVQPFLLLFFVLFALIGLMVARRTLLDSGRHDAAAGDHALTKGSLAERAKATLQRVGRVDSSLVFGAPISAFGLQYLITEHLEYGPAWSAVGFAAFYLLLARLVLAARQPGLRLLGEAYAIVGTIFITLAIPLAFEGRWTGAAWAVEAAGMYWLGIRQQRRYARGFALLVLLGAAYKLLGDTQLDLTHGTPLLQGSWIGPLLMAAGALVIWALHRQAGLHQAVTSMAATAQPSGMATDAQHVDGSQRGDRWERAEAQMASIAPWLGIGALTLLLWQTLTPTPASAATAVLALLVDRLAAWLDQRLALLPRWTHAVSPALQQGLRWLITSLQGASVVAFAVSQHQATATLTAAAASEAAQRTTPVLSQGWTGAASAVVIALSLLVTVASPLLRMRRAMLAQALGSPGASDSSEARLELIDQEPVWQARHAVLAVVAAGLLHVAMLFGLSADTAAQIWPLSGLLVVFAGLWLALPPLAWAGLALQPLAIGLKVFGGTPEWLQADGRHVEAAPLMDGSFWLALSVAVAGLVAAYWLHAERRRLMVGVTAAGSAPQATPVADWFGWQMVAANGWTLGRYWQPVLVGWGLLWWLTGWLSEGERSLKQAAAINYEPALQVAVLVISSVALATLARRWRWHAAIGWTMPTVLGLWWVLLTGSTQLEHPLQHGGWLVWPLAILWSYRLLLQQQRWNDHPSDAMHDSHGLLRTALPHLHVLTLWLWTLLATLQTRFCLGHISPTASLHRGQDTPMAQAAPTTAMDLLVHPLIDTDSWSLVGWVLPMLAVLWGLRSTALIRRWPLTKYGDAYQQLGALPLVLWTLSWFWGANLIGAGHAWPLPYLPLLNPLDLVLAGSLIVLTGWWRALPSTHPLQQQRRVVLGVLAASALAWVTAAALRGCHHYGGVPWELDAMLHSRLAQATLSITWALSGVLAMVAGHKTVQRTVWLAGTALLAVVVAKLFLVDLADHGGLYRIVSFLAVGVLMLVVGYFAPVPPVAQADDREERHP